jgi:hypothetical protein
MLKLWRKWGGAALAASFATAALAEDGRMTFPIPDGFVKGAQTEDASKARIYYLPLGETTADWTRMTTSVVIFGAAQRASAVKFSQVMIDVAGRSCPGFKASPITETTVSGRPAARLQIDCAVNPRHGGPETFIALTFAGPQDLYQVQVAFRRVPTAEDLKWGEAVLGATRWCSTDSFQPPCVD